MRGRRSKSLSDSKGGIRPSGDADHHRKKLLEINAEVFGNKGYRDPYLHDYTPPNFVEQNEGKERTDADSRSTIDRTDGFNNSNNNSNNDQRQRLFSNGGVSGRSRISSFDTESGAIHRTHHTATSTNGTSLGGFGHGLFKNISVSGDRSRSQYILDKAMEDNEYIENGDPLGVAIGNNKYKNKQINKGRRKQQQQNDRDHSRNKNNTNDRLPSDKKSGQQSNSSRGRRNNNNEIRDFDAYTGTDWTSNKMSRCCLVAMYFGLLISFILYIVLIVIRYYNPGYIDNKASIYKDVTVLDLSYYSEYLFEFVVIVVFLYFLFEYYFLTISGEKAVRRTNRLREQSGFGNGPSSLHPPIDEENRRLDIIASQYGITDNSKRNNRNNNNNNTNRSVTGNSIRNQNQNENQYDNNSSEDKISRVTYWQFVKIKRSVKVWYLLLLDIISMQWTRFSILIIGCILYDVLGGIFLLMSVVENSGSDIDDDDSTLLNMILFFLRAFGDILPAVCLDLYLHALVIYEPIAKRSDFDLATLLAGRAKNMSLVGDHGHYGGDSNDNYKFKLGHMKSNNKKFNKAFDIDDNTKTLAAVSSILNDGLIRAWIFLISLFKLIFYIVSPLSPKESGFNDIVKSFICYDNNNECNSSLYQAMFVVTLIFLQQFRAMVQVYSCVMCAVVGWSGHGGYYQATPLHGLSYVLTPLIIVAFTFLMFLDLNFIFLGDYKFFWILDTIWCMLYLVVVCFLLWLLCGILGLQKKAERKRDRFHAFSKPTTIVLIFEGAIFLCGNLIFIISMVLYVACDGKARDLIGIIRQALIFTFNAVIIFMIYSLRPIAAEPTFRTYFHKKNKIKYIFGFRLICVLLIYNIMYQTVYQTNKFMYIYTQELPQNDTTDDDTYDVIYNVTTTGPHATKCKEQLKFAFTMSFCLMYYNLWALEHISKWVFSKYDDDSSIAQKQIEKVWIDGTHTSDAFSIDPGASQASVTLSEIGRQMPHQPLTPNQKVQFLLETTEQQRHQQLYLQNATTANARTGTRTLTLHNSGGHIVHRRTGSINNSVGNEKFGYESFDPHEHGHPRGGHGHHGYHNHHGHISIDKQDNVNNLDTVSNGNNINNINNVNNVNNINHGIRENSKFDVYSGYGTNALAAHIQQKQRENKAHEEKEKEKEHEKDKDTDKEQEKEKKEEEKQKGKVKRKEKHKDKEKDKNKHNEKVSRNRKRKKEKKQNRKKYKKENDDTSMFLNKTTGTALDEMKKSQQLNQGDDLIDDDDATITKYIDVMKVYKPHLVDANGDGNSVGIDSDLHRKLTKKVSLDERKNKEKDGHKNSGKNKDEEKKKEKEKEKTNQQQGHKRRKKRDEKRDRPKTKLHTHTNTNTNTNTNTQQHRTVNASEISDTKERSGDTSLAMGLIDNELLNPYGKQQK